MEKKQSSPVTFKSTFLALTFPNYRLWYFGQIVSLLGTMMQTTAQGYLVYELTGSTVMLGIVALATAIPNWILMLPAGVLAERFSRQRLILIAQIWLMFLAFVLSVFTFFGIVEPWHIIILAGGTGLAFAMTAPARHAFVAELVDKNAITNAIGLNSTMFNIGTFIGPAIGGIVYAVVGPGLCFAINGVSFIAVIIALGLMKLAPKLAETVSQKKHWLHDLIEGIKYTVRHPQIRIIIIITGFFSFFGFSIITMFPAWAVDILHGDAATFGFLQSSRGLGALLSALFIAFMAQFSVRGRLVTIGLFGIPAAMIAFSFISAELLAFAIIFVYGIMVLLVFNNANALVQSLVDEAFRGRVMSVYMLVFIGCHPLGALVNGLLADSFGLEHTMLLYGSVLVVMAFAVFIFIPIIRRLE